MSLDGSYYREELSPPAWAEGTLVGCIVLTSGLLTCQLLTGSRLGSKPAPNPVLSMIDATLIGVYFTFWRLTITLDHEGLRLSFSRIKRRIPYGEMESVELYPVGLGEYGGLGLRYGNRGGEALTSRLGDGVKVERRGRPPVVFTPGDPRRLLRLMGEFREAYA